MIKPFLIPHTEGRMIIYANSTDTIPTTIVNGQPLVTGSKLIITGTEPKEYLWNGLEWVSSNASSGGAEMIYNATGATLAIGDLVYRNGWNATNNCFTVAKADADLADSKAELVITESIVNNTTGTASTRYKLTGQNTNAATAVGDPVYLNTTAGGWTLTAPSAANSIVQIVGRVSVKNATTGEIQFNISGNLNKIGSNELQSLSVTEAKLAAPKAGLNAHRVAMATYDFAVKGGAVGTITLDTILPINAIITRSWYDVITAVTSGGAATFALTTGETAGDIVADAVLGTNGTLGIHEGVSTGTAATMKKMTAARTISIVIGTAALTAGKLNIFCEYVISA